MPEDQFSFVLDITLAYPEGQPLDLGTIVLGYRRPCKTLFFYRLYRIDEVSTPNKQKQI